MAQNKNQPGKKTSGASAGPQGTYDTYEIHPRIGIARLGASDQVFLAPEPDCKQAQFDGTAAVPRPARTPPPATYREKPGGALMRQAVRFRVFKVTRNKQTQEVVLCNELRLKNGTATAIAWKVHLANSKAAAQQFADEDGNIITDPTVVRNPDVQNRDDLVIDSKERTPKGNSIATAQVLQGKFKGKAVTLGHAWTDDEERLLVAGGFGKSESPTGDALDPDRFADNDGW